MENRLARLILGRYSLSLMLGATLGDMLWRFAIDGSMLWCRITLGGVLSALDEPSPRSSMEKRLPLGFDAMVAGE